MSRIIDILFWNENVVLTIEISCQLCSDCCYTVLLVSVELQFKWSLLRFESIKVSSFWNRNGNRNFLRRCYILQFKIPFRSISNLPHRFILSRITVSHWMFFMPQLLLFRVVREASLLWRSKLIEGVFSISMIWFVDYETSNHHRGIFAFNIFIYGKGAANSWIFPYHVVK